MADTQVTQVTQKQNRLDRELDARVQFERPEAWRPPEVLPMPNPRPGWDHKYIRVSVMGKDDPSNISSKLREGYEPCRAQDYPELMMHATTEGRFKGGIEVGGLLLCRIPEEFVRQRAEYYARQNKAQMESVDSSYLRENHPSMRKFAHRDSQVTFGPNSKT
jgi:hypothetical protein